MPRRAPAIAELLNPPSRFMRSVQLDRDFDDAGALASYVVTPDVASAFQRVAEGLSSGSGRRAWRVTGDYGVGKSSFALVLAQLLSRPDAPDAHRIAVAIGWVPSSDAARLWPILATGARERIASTIGRGVAECLARRKPGSREAKAWRAMSAQAASVERSGDPEALMDLLAAVRAQATSQGAGVLLVVDEMGKLLEQAALDGGRGDVFVLQRLAELAARSGPDPLVFVGLLHQGFQAYAERLPSVVRHEWDKVAGRFEEVVFDQPLAHTAALVAGALGVSLQLLDPAIAAAARKVAAATGTMGWLSGGTTTVSSLDAAPLYPIHPTLLPPLVRFFARYGQHERSLFGFLLSTEPFGLQAFASRKAAAEAWYGLPEFYDYVRGTFGHRLSGGSYRSHWLRISGTVDAAQDVPALELRVLKAVAVLNLLDADDLLATDRALAACFCPEPASAVAASAATLVDRGLLFRWGAAAGYRLWPTSSVNLHAAFEAAARATGDVDRVAQHLAPLLPRDPVLARRHYVERGTMRYFEVRHVPVGAADGLGHGPSDADGLLLVFLTDTEEERRSALEAAASGPLAARDEVVVGVSRPLAELGPALKDLRCWQWVLENTPELGHDAYSAAEVKRQLAAAREALAGGAAVSSGLRHGAPDHMTWLHGGKPLDPPAGLSSALSDVCDAIYPAAPRVANELVNRNALSSAAAAARMRLIEGIFEASDRPFLGIDPVRAPPEKSMYLSVMQKGRLHREGAGGHELAMPAEDDDPLNLGPALHEIQRRIEAGAGERVSVAEILQALARRPFGVRRGLAPLLLALVLKIRSHELAVYENGTFRAAFGGQDAMRLIKAPASFEVQHCRLEGMRADAFRRLAEAFADRSSARPPEVLDVVQPLCRFAARLPEYTRRAGKLSPRAAAVRDVLLSAVEPAGLLFKDLPSACGLEAFAVGAAGDARRAQDFVLRLKEAVDELRADYPHLLTRITDTVAQAVGQEGPSFDRARLAARAAQVTLTANQPRLRTFALRLRDLGTSDDAWAEALASYVAAKPPSKWTSADEARAHDELASLCRLFVRVEAAAFEPGRERPDGTAVRINLTRADGEDRVHIVRSSSRDEASARELDAARGRLPRDKELRLQLLMDLLWEELAPAEGSEAPQHRQVEKQGLKSA